MAYCIMTNDKGKVTVINGQKAGLKNCVTAAVAQGSKNKFRVVQQLSALTKAELQAIVDIIPEGKTVREACSTDTTLIK